MSSAIIIPFPSNLTTSNKLSVRDKTDVCLWERAVNVPDLSRVVIHDQIDVGTDQSGLVLVYGEGSPWAQWGIARRGPVIAVWQCSDGAELGLFRTMSAALEALEHHVLLQRTASTRSKAAKPGRSSRVP